jgi:hypothetical protein
LCSSTKYCLYANLGIANMSIQEISSSLRDFESSDLFVSCKGIIMITNACELTDNNTAIQRLRFRFLWCSVGAVPLLAISLLFFRHLLMPVLVTCLFLILYISGTGFALDKWRISHPTVSKQILYVISVLSLLPIFPVMFLCFKLIS